MGAPGTSEQLGLVIGQGLGTSIGETPLIAASYRAVLCVSISPELGHEHSWLMLSVRRCVALRPRHFCGASLKQKLGTYARRIDPPSPVQSLVSQQHTTFLLNEQRHRDAAVSAIDEEGLSVSTYNTSREPVESVRHVSLTGGPSPGSQLGQSTYEDDGVIIHNSIVIKNVAKEVSEHELLRFMKETSLVSPYALKFHLHNGIFSGMAFAKFTSSNEAASAIDALNYSDFRGRQLQVEYKKRVSMVDRARIDAIHLARRASHRSTIKSSSQRISRLQPFGIAAKGQISSLLSGLEHKSFKYWANVLNFLVRVEGREGALRILNLLDKHKVLLPTKGDDAKELWTTLVLAGVHDSSRAILERTFQHAQQIYATEGRVWTALYETIIGHFLESLPNEARSWNLRLGHIGLPTETSLHRLVSTAVKSRSRLDTLKMLHYESKHSNLYDVLIPALCRHGDFVAAAHWDRYLKDYDDCPTSSQFDLSNLNITSSESLQTADSAHTASEEKVVGSVPFTARPRKSQGGLSDTFAARCFATKAFSLDAISHGLKSIGLSSLGPLAMREIAARCNGAADILRQVKVLEENKVPIQDCVYSRFIHFLATQCEEQILSCTIQSDLHPDAFEDVELQHRLLTFYIKSKDWAQAHRTLTLLAIAFNESGVHFWNLMLSAHFMDKDWQNAKAVYELMLARGMPISQRTIRLSFFAIEARTYIKMADRGERRAFKMQNDDVDDLKFVTNMWLKIQRAGGFVSPKSWNQLHKYYGQDYRLTEFETLSVWLAMHYSQTSPLAQGKRHLTSGWRRHSRARWSEPQNALAAIFTPLRQRSIIEWGFKTLATKRSHRSPLGFEPSANGPSGKSADVSWDRGLLLLRELHRHGVRVDKANLRKACQCRLAIMFSDGMQVSSRKENRIAQLLNDEDFLTVVRRINKIWNLWPSLQGQDMTEAQAWSLIGRRRGRPSPYSSMSRRATMFSTPQPG